ncbi:MAG TPA: glycosyltransferase [Levilinea sp.]|nr:glycosyltransferase [Levilinea sp.]
MKRIVILTADAGFGHRSAANAVAAALNELHGDDCQVIILNPLDDKRTPFFLRDSQADYDNIITNLPELYKLGYDFSDATVTSVLVDSALSVLLFEVMRDVIKKHKPDAIVTTYPLYQSPLIAVASVTKIVVPILTVITDLVTAHRLWFNNDVDACLGSTEAVIELAREYGIPGEKIHLTGIPVHPNLAKEKRAPVEIRRELGWHEHLPTFLAVGSRRVERLLETLNVLNHYGMPLQLAVVAGKDKDLFRLLEENEWHVPVKLYEFVENIAPLMHAADAVICKAGGLIVTEALATGTPLILIQALPGQETGNAEYVVSNRAGDLVEEPQQVLEVLHHWMKNDACLLKERAANARRLGRPESAYTVASLAWLAANHKRIRKPGWLIERRNRIIGLLERNKINWQAPFRARRKK